LFKYTAWSTYWWF